MKIFRLALFATTLLGINTSAFAAGPTNTFGQETANTLDNGVIQYDLLGSGNTHLRMGAFGGEMIFNVSADTAQYKKKISDNFAFHAGLGITTTATTSTTTLVIGGAYTMNQESVVLNVNPVITSAAGTSTVNLGLGAFLPLGSGDNIEGKILAGLAIDIPVSPSGNSTILLGARWEVKSNLTLEAGLYDNGTGLQFPGLFRINLTI